MDENEFISSDPDGELADDPSGELKNELSGELGSDLAADSDPADDKPLYKSLRPPTFDEYIGQPEIVERFRVAVGASIERSDTLDHVLLHGAPGLGKTTLAHIVAREMDARIISTSGPALERPADVVGLLSNLEQGDVFFIDEIHRLSRSVEEYLYSAMEDFRVDFTTGAGAFARSINLPLNQFTLIGSTTRAGMLSAPLRERFGLQYHLDFYGIDEIVKVVKRSAEIMEFDIQHDSALVLAESSRGTPRIANRLLRRLRDYAQVKKQSGISQVEQTRAALKLEGIDAQGLEKLDRMYLNTVATNYNGGPVGIDAIAATINEEANTLIDMVEPFLLKINFIVRTSQGRRITEDGLQHIGVTLSDDSPQTRLV